MWRLRGAFLQAAVGALAALSAEHIDPTTLAAHIATITTLLDTLRTVGMNMYGTFYDAVLARVLIAAGPTRTSRARLDTGLQLAQDTVMCLSQVDSAVSTPTLGLPTLAQLPLPLLQIIAPKP